MLIIAQAKKAGRFLILAGIGQIIEFFRSKHQKFFHYLYGDIAQVQLANALEDISLKDAHLMFFA